MSKITCFTDEKRLRVYVPNVPVCTGTTRTHVSTCVRVVPVHTGTFERAHGDVLSGHTAPHTTPHHAHTPHHTTRHNTPHGDRDRDRQRQTETEKEDRDRERREDGRGETRQEKRRQKKTRQDKRREKINFQCGGAWPFFVGVVIFWLIPFAHET